MPGQPLETEALVLLKFPPADTFVRLTLFSAAHGLLTALQRLPARRLSSSSASSLAPLDLFDEAALHLESANQGQTWFVRETRLITRHPNLGQTYETLQHASLLAQFIIRNPLPEESRAPAYAHLRTALAAFAAHTRSDIVYLKTLYLLVRDEGYPLKQQWFPTLPAADRDDLAQLLRQPVAAQTAPAATVERLLRRLTDYLRGHTELQFT